jgi:hypothetical protein
LRALLSVDDLTGVTAVVLMMFGGEEISEDVWILAGSERSADGVT